MGDNMDKEKFKMYTLYAKIYGTDSSKYTIEESLRDDSKRKQVLMFGEKIEDLDKITDDYESVEDLLESYPKEVYGQSFLLYDPVIIVDKDMTDREKSYAIYDIVFREDAEALKNRKAIKEELQDYLIENPEEIEKFRGINKIYGNLRQKYPSMGILPLINNTLKIYFEGDNYKRYREVYFKLKELNKRKNKQR